MTYTAQAFACTISVIALFMFVVWVKSIGRIPPQIADERGRPVSYALLAAWLLAPPITEIMFGDYSRDPSALLKEGLSRQNVAQVVVALSALGWALRLLVARRVRASSLITGVNFWFAALIGFYTLSAAWSIWPTMTIFRVTELGAFWVLTVHLFSGRAPLVPLTWCLLAAALFLVLCGAIFGWPDYAPLQIFGRYDENQYAMFTGALMVILLSRILVLGETRCSVLLLPTFIAFVLFGSLTSAIALLFATLTLLIFRWSWRLGKVTEFLIIIGCLSSFTFVLRELIHDPNIMAWVASVTGKNQEMLATATGRASLWEGIWQSNKNAYIGFGFGAAERLLFAYIPPPLDFNPGNAHDGFLSAWISGGWFAAWIVVWACASIIFDAVKRPYHDRAYMISLTLFLVINNLSYPVIGSFFNTGCFVMMVLACAGQTVVVRRGAERPHRLNLLAEMTP